MSRIHALRAIQGEIGGSPLSVTLRAGAGEGMGSGLARFAAMAAEDAWMRKAKGMAHEIQSIMAEGFGRDRANKVLGLLEAAGLLVEEVMDIDHLGIHPSNRAGVGAVPQGVHQLLYKIIHDGFIWLEVNRKIARPSGHPPTLLSSATALMSSPLDWTRVVRSGPSGAG